MARLKTILQTFLLGYIVVSMGFGYVAPVAAQDNVRSPIDILSSEGDTPLELPKYGGVEETIAAYLCVPSSEGTALYTCINKMYRLGIAVGALVLVFFVVLAGYMYITGSEKGKASAKDMIYSALTGLAVILLSYVLLSFINPDLVKFKPIQPPIFSAADLPKCEDIGFSRDCVISSGPNAGQVVSTGGTYGGRTCSPITNNASPASVDNLSRSCFAQYGTSVVKQASIVASRESGGNPSLPVGAGSCGKGKAPARCTGGEIPVWGLYQINITVHKVAGLNCPAAFSGGWTCSRQCTVVNKDLYNRCVEAAKNATSNINVACELYQRNKAAGRPGFNDWGNVANEHGKKCGF